LFWGRGSQQQDHNGQGLRADQDRKQTINTNETFDFLREIVSSIPDPTESEPTSTSAAAAGPSKRKPRSTAKAGRSITTAQESQIPDVKPGYMPDVGTWKKDMEGGGGTGEGGRGMFDDYEDDDEDY
jgi:hypothetical protein